MYSSLRGHVGLASDISDENWYMSDSSTLGDQNESYLADLNRRGILERHQGGGYNLQWCRRWAVIFVAGGHFSGD